MNLTKLLTKFNPFAKKADPLPVESVEQETMETDITETPTPKKSKKEVAPGMQHNWKLSEQEKQIAVSLWATGLTSPEVVERMREEHNVSISVVQVLKYTQAEKWQALIRKIKQETYADLASIAGSHKKVRLSRGEKVYEKAIKKGDLKHALAATESQRKEMEGAGDTLHLTLNQFNVLSDDELQVKHREALEKVKRLTEKKGITLVQPTNQAETTGS